MDKAVRISALFGLLLLSAGCSDLNTLADNAPPMATVPSTIPSGARPQNPSALDAPAEMKAKGVIKKGDVQGTYNGAVYSCGNPDCTIAVRTPYPAPSSGKGQSSPDK